MKDIFKSHIGRQVVIFVSPIVAWAFILLSFVESNDRFEVTYNLLGYLVAVMVAIYAIGWIITNLFCLLLERAFKQEGTACKRFWMHLLLSQLLVVLLLNYLIVAYLPD